MVTKISKRDGRIEKYQPEKITWAIFKAATACGGSDFGRAEELCRQVNEILNKQFKDRIPGVEDIQDIVEKVLIENGHAKTAKAYILYREKRKSARDLNALVGATINMFSDYLGTGTGILRRMPILKKCNGLNNYVREVFTKKYWLYEIYPAEVREAHENGDCHIHDLGFFGPYCAGWDLRQLLLTDSAVLKVKWKAGRQSIEIIFGTNCKFHFHNSGRNSRSSAWSSFDTYCAPFIRYDNMTYEQVKQCLQEFVFNINVPTRVGFQCPFQILHLT